MLDSMCQAVGRCIYNTGILVALGINPAFLAVLVEAHFTKFRGARDGKKNTNIIGDKVKLR